MKQVIQKKWFVFKDTKMEDCQFCSMTDKKVIVYPRYELLVKGKKVPSGTYYNRDKGTEQVLRALGLRCGVEKYKVKLVKMMSFNPENNIDKFIQECVLDEHPIRSMKDIREHRQQYNDAKAVYEELANGKIQLEEVQRKIVDYEVAERKYETRRILLLYQEMKWCEENRLKLKNQIASGEAQKVQLQLHLEELEEKRRKALDRKIEAEKNDLLYDIEKILKSLEARILDLEKDIKTHESNLEELEVLENGIQNILDSTGIEQELTEQERAIVETLASTSFLLEEKVDAFVKLKQIVKVKKKQYQTQWVRTDDRIITVREELGTIQNRITSLQADVLPFDNKYENAKQIIKKELEEMNIQTDVRLFAELVQSIDKDWQLAIETFLGWKRFDIIVDGQYCQKVMEIVHRHKLKNVKVIITDQLPDEKVRPDSAASLLDIPNEYGRKYANFLLNGIHLCADLHELHDYPRGGLMMDGTLAKSYGMNCMDLEKTQMFLGKDAIKLQLKRAKEEKLIRAEEEKQLEQKKTRLTAQIDDIEAVNWDETRYVFDVQKKLDDSKTELCNKKVELEEAKNTPGFTAALKEKENAHKEYQDADNQYVKANTEKNTCENSIRENKMKYESSKQKIIDTKKEYEATILLRLELRKEVLALYEKLRGRSDSARVMAWNTVEKVKGEKENTIRLLENEQRKYWRIIGQNDEKYGVGYIRVFREQLRDIANVKIEEAKQKLEEKQRDLENAFMVDFVAEINATMREAQNEIDEINRELKHIPFGKDTYQFRMIEKPDRMMFFNICKTLENHMNSMDMYRSMNHNDSEMEYNIKQFMDVILEEENEEEYTDYRKYFRYDMKIFSKQDGEETTADLSKKQGSASNGEKQTPYFIILAASLLQCYPKQVSCARLAFIDEAFSALSRERIEQMVGFFEDNKFQVIYAAPSEKIDSIGSYINSTISLCTKGKYTWAVEGLVKIDGAE